jgi:hypothetical protein
VQRVHAQLVLVPAYAAFAQCLLFFNQDTPSSAAVGGSGVGGEWPGTRLSQTVSVVTSSVLAHGRWRCTRAFSTTCRRTLWIDVARELQTIADATRRIKAASVSVSSTAPSRGRSPSPRTFAIPRSESLVHVRPANTHGGRLKRWW